MTRNKGKGYELTPDKWLSQPGQFVCKEKVVVIGPKKTFERVSIIGPIRKNTQIEMSKTDLRQFGVDAVHIDTDEGNAALTGFTAEGELVE